MRSKDCRGELEYTVKHSNTDRKLCRLQITCCKGFDRSSIDEIRKLVEELEWDGLNGWPDDSDDELIDIDGREFYVEDFYSSE